MGINVEGKHLASLMTSMALTLKILPLLMLIFCTSVSAIPITSDFYRYNGLGRYTDPWSASQMNMGERGDILEYYGGDDSDPIYLDDGEEKDVERGKDTDPNGILSR